MDNLVDMCIHEIDNYIVSISCCTPYRVAINNLGFRCHLWTKETLSQSQDDHLSSDVEKSSDSETISTPQIIQNSSLLIITRWTPKKIFAKNHREQILILLTPALNSGHIPPTESQWKDKARFRLVGLRVRLRVKNRFWIWWTT